MMYRSIFIILVVFFAMGCDQVKEHNRLSCGELNMRHLGYLYDRITMEGGTEAGIVHIYSEYPDYSYAIEPREGYTCVDDVARAVVLLSACNASESRNQNARVIEQMVDFILAMQSDTGYFYNFIWNDGTINRTYRTTRAVPDWWSWRAFWALETFAETGKEQSEKISEASEALAGRVFEDLLTDGRTVREVDGVETPGWLPGETAADQAGVLILALAKYYDRTGDQRATEMIRQLAEGILLMQAGDSLSFPYGAFLSWNNIWHAYGNVQSYALLVAGELMGKKEYTDRALMEVDHFYPWLAEQGYLNYFILKRDEEGYAITEQQQFPQIAYGFRPMIFSCLKAYRVTGKEKYLNQAEEIARWFTGDNAAGRRMYDPVTGRCFDAINSEEEINRNAGAESTIEALLSLQALEEAGIALTKLYEDE